MGYNGKYAGWKGMQVRIPPDMHKELLHKAVDDDTNLVEIITAGVLAYLDGDIKVDATAINVALAGYIDDGNKG